MAILVADLAVVFHLSIVVIASVSGAGFVYFDCCYCFWPSPSVLSFFAIQTFLALSFFVSVADVSVVRDTLLRPFLTATIL